LVDGELDLVCWITKVVDAHIQEDFGVLEFLSKL